MFLPVNGVVNCLCPLGYTIQPVKILYVFVGVLISIGIYLIKCAVIIV